MPRITPTNIKREIDGVAVDYYGVQLVIARGNSEPYRKLFTELTRPYRRQISNDSLPESTQQKIVVECLSKHVLKGWSGYTDEDGNEIPYSVEEAQKLLHEDVDCRKFVAEFSSDLRNYIDEKTEVTAK